jgi:hypothetical protein
MEQLLEKENEATNNERLAHDLKKEMEQLKRTLAASQAAAAAAATRAAGGARADASASAVEPTDKYAEMSALLQDSQVCSLSFALSSWEHVLVLNDAGIAGEAVFVSALVYALGVIGGVACRYCVLLGGVAEVVRPPRGRKLLLRKSLLMPCLVDTCMGCCSEQHKHQCTDALPCMYQQGKASAQQLLHCNS